MSWTDSKSLRKPQLQIDSTIRSTEEFIDFARRVGSNEILGTRGLDHTVLFGAEPNAAIENHQAKAKIAKEKIRAWAEANHLNVDSIPVLKPECRDTVRGTDILSAVIGKKLKAQIVDDMIKDSSPRPEENAKPLIAVVMGQGVVGRLDLNRFCSDSFDSCVPVVLFNANTKVGGLFHLPCPEAVDKSLPKFTDPEVPNALAEIVRLVQPTEIRVRPGSQADPDRMCSPSLAANIMKRARAVCKCMENIVLSSQLQTSVRFEEEPTAYILVSMKDDELSVGTDANPSAIAVVSRDNKLPERFSGKLLSWSHFRPGYDATVKTTGYLRNLGF